MTRQSECVPIAGPMAFRVAWVPLDCMGRYVVPSAYRSMAALLHFRDSVSASGSRFDEASWCQWTMFAACATKHRSVDDMLKVAAFQPYVDRPTKDPWAKFRQVDRHTKQPISFKSADMLLPAGIHVVDTPVAGGETFCCVGDGTEAQPEGSVRLRRGAANHVRLASPTSSARGAKRGAASAAQATRWRRRRDADPMKAMAAACRGGATTAVSVFDIPERRAGGRALSHWHTANTNKSAAMSSKRRSPASSDSARRRKRST